LDACKVDFNIVNSASRGVVLKTVTIHFRAVWRVYFVAGHARSAFAQPAPLIDMTPTSIVDRAAHVFIIDDDPAVLRALRRLFRAHGFIVEAFESPQPFLERPRPDGPAVLILDLRMPGLSGLEVQQMVTRKGEEIPIVFLSGASDVPKTAQAMRDGALDFLVKPADETQLLDAVSRALAKDAQLRQIRDEQRQAAARVARLTRREREVCDLVVRGLINKQIASELGIAEKTVKVHRGRAMQKLEVDSVASLVRLLSLLQRQRTGS
jgi:FixJ family two-component response regulator